MSKIIENSMSRALAGLALGGLLLALLAGGSCAGEDQQQISQAHEDLTYGDTMGQDADELIELLESA